MIFRQLLDPDTSTWTYLLGDPRTREAILIDPVREQADRDLALIRELGLTLAWVADTHVHADHVTAAQVLATRTGCKTAVSKRSEGVAKRLVDHGDVLTFGHQLLEVRATPGHTSGCVTYVLGDLSRAFTGDALLIRGCGRTDFQQGDAATLYHSVHDQILSLPDDTLLYPGHDYRGRTVTTVREEKLHNPRLGGGKTVAEFAAIMGSLGLAYPKRMDVAVPANLRGGRLPGDDDAKVAPDAPWAPVVRTGTGAPNLPVDWCAEHLAGVRIVDVRQPEEYADGHVEGAALVPLDVLAGEAVTWARDLPMVLVCRSGGRSDRAAIVLEGMGFSQVASMQGGMLAWAARGLPTVSGGSEQG